MKLIRLYIAGFGNLQDYSYDFNEGINKICAPNGWGKSTFASFICSMFYGLGDTRARSVAENPRKRYMPFAGGSFGGNLEFEADGKSYRIERFFGAKESEDTFALFDLATGKQSEDYTESIGQELFGIDADGFSRTVYMDAAAHVHGKVDKSANNSINTKLNHLLEAENDLGNYEEAMEALLRRKRYYKTTGERGEIYTGERRMLELQRQIEQCQAQKASAQELDAQIAQLSPAVAESEQRMLALQKELTAASSQKERRAVLEAYSRMRSEISAAKKEAEAIEAEFSGEVPTLAEAEKHQLLAGQLTTLQGRAAQLQSDQSTKQALLSMASTFAGGITPLAEIDRALEICNELRDIESEIRAHKAMADSLQDRRCRQDHWRGTCGGFGSAFDRGCRAAACKSGAAWHYCRHWRCGGAGACGLCADWCHFRSAAVGQIQARGRCCVQDRNETQIAGGARKGAFLGAVLQRSIYG